MQPNLISNAGSQESRHYQAIDREELRERAMETQQKLILNEVQLGEPKTCNAFSDHCATWLVRDLAYDLCLARIQKDDGLLQQALAQLDTHIKNTLAEFCEEESEKRIAAAQQAAEAQILARLEYDHA